VSLAFMASLTRGGQAKGAEPVYVVAVRSARRPVARRSLRSLPRLRCCSEFGTENEILLAVP